MRKLLSLTLLITLLIGNAFAINEEIGLSTSNTNQELVVTNQTTTSITLHNSIATISLEDINTRGGNFVKLASNGYYKNTQVGAPQLPMLSKLVEIPHGANVQVSVLSYDEEVINLSSYGFQNQIQPLQQSYSKSDDPDNYPFDFNQNIYSSNNIYSNELVSVEFVGESRGVRIGNLKINPFSYNPQTNELTIKNNLSIEISFINADLQLTKSKKQQYYSPAFSSVFSNMLSAEQTQTKDGIVDYGPVKYIIVADRMFETTLDPFIEWKTKKGFNVIEAYTDVIGTTTTDIKTYLQDQYENPSDGVAPSYVLFVGDISQIPSWNSTNTGSGGTDHISDLYYCEFTGDYIPELYYGRFSANTTAELAPQLDKSIEYERFEMADPSFLNEVVLVAGVDAGFAPSHGNGQINYGLNEYFNAAHGFTDVHHYLYGSGSPITSDNAAASGAIQQNVSDGVGFVNYTAHCDWNGWADPSFLVGSDISNLTNDGKYSLMIGNCCRSSRFNTTNNGGTCFGEEIMRAANAGVIGYIGGSDWTYWDEDFYWGTGVDQIGITEATANSHTYDNTGLGAYDGSFHEHGEADADWYVTSGQLMFVGNLAVTEGGSSYVHYYWEIYHLMGDPSLMTYYTVPTVITASYTNSVPVGTASLTVNTDAPGSYVAISKDGVLLDAQLADANGDITLNFTAFSTTGTADVVVTKQNRAPYIGTIIIVAGTEPPIADFVADQTVIWEGETVNFTDLSTQAPSSWDWTFGDLGTDDVQNPSYIYTTAGTYTVTLQSYNGNGDDIEEKIAYITVNAITEVPVVDFAADQTVVNIAQTVNFTDLSTLQPFAWTWDFGDGTLTSLNQNPSHTYATPGFYTVTLTAENTVGPNTEIKINYIEVVDEPYCDAYSASTTMENITNVTFGTIDNDSGSDGYADYTSMSTDINNGDTYTFSVNYDKNKSTDEVYVWIDWNQNNIFEDTEKFNVANGPGSAGPYNYDILVPANATAGTTTMRVRLHNTASGPNDTPCGESGVGEVEDYSVNIICVVNPIADFSYTQNAATITFTNLSTDAYSYSWDFDDGSFSTEENPIHEFTANGAYDVVLTAINGCGSVDITYMITITGVGVLVLNSERIAIYPNPADQYLMIKSDFENFSYQIIASDGKLMIEGESKLETEQSIDVSHLSSGVYNLIINHDNGQVSQKIIIK